MDRTDLDNVSFVWANSLDGMRVIQGDNIGDVSYDNDGCGIIDGDNNIDVDGDSEMLICRQMCMMCEMGHAKRRFEKESITPVRQI